MADFRQWLHAQLSRLDGARERKIVGFGALALLVFLNVGPTVFKAAAQAVTIPFKKPRAAAPTNPVRVLPAPSTLPAVSETEAPGASDVPAPVPEETPLPSFAFLFPLPGAEASGPITIAGRVENATAVAMLIELATPSGARFATLPATPSLSGEWHTLFAGEPGTYVASARVSLDNGRVVAFKEQRAFQIVPSQAEAAPADPSEPLVELTSPDSVSAYDAFVPLSARVKNAESDRLIFIVTAPDGYETLVLGTALSGTGYWTGIFQGTKGVYRARARATIGDRDVFSPEVSILLNGPAP